MVSIGMTSFLPVFSVVDDWARAVQPGCSRRTFLTLTTWNCPGPGFSDLTWFLVACFIAAFLLLPTADWCLRDHLANPTTSLASWQLNFVVKCMLLIGILAGCWILVAGNQTATERVRLGIGMAVTIAILVWLRSRLLEGRNLEAPLWAILGTQAVLGGFPYLLALPLISLLVLWVIFAEVSRQLRRQPADQSDAVNDGWGDGLRGGLQSCGYSAAAAQTSVDVAGLMWRAGAFMLFLMSSTWVLVLVDWHSDSVSCPNGGAWYCVGPDAKLIPELIVTGWLGLVIIGGLARWNRRHHPGAKVGLRSPVAPIVISMLVAVQFWPTEYFLQRQGAFPQLHGVIAVALASSLLGLGLLIRLSANSTARWHRWPLVLATLALAGLSLPALAWSPVLLTLAIVVGRAARSDSPLGEQLYMHPYTSCGVSLS
jgi:hypothetical protein